MTRVLSHKYTKIAGMIVLNIAVMLICAFLLVPQTDTNDDIIIHTYTSQAYGEATRYLGYTGIALAELLYGLQAAVPAYNWFVILEFLCIFLSFGALSFIAVCRCDNWIGIAFGCALSLLFAPQFYNWIHYTKNAMLFALTGMLLIFFALSAKRVKVTCLALGGFLSFMGAQLRMQAFWAGCSFAFLIGIYIASHFSGISSLKAWLRKYAKYLITFACVFVLVLGMDAAKSAVYEKNGDAAEFWAYCNTRAALSDYDLPSYKDHYTEYQTLGITQNDLELIDSWSFGDLEFFDTQTLQAILDMRAQQSLWQTLARFVADIPNALFNKPLFYVSVFLFGLCLIFCKKRELLLAVALLLCFVACFIYQYHIGRTTRWVQYGFITCFAASLLYCLDTRRFRLRKPIWTTVGAAVTAAALLLSFVSYHTECADYNNYFRVSYNNIYAEINADAQSLYLADLGTLTDPVTPTFSSVPDNIFYNIYRLGGWDTGAANKNSVLERYGVTGSPYRALVEQNNVYLIDTTNYVNKATFINEHIDPAARYSLIKTVGMLYVFAFSTNLAPSAYTQTGDIGLSNAVAIPYAHNASFLTLIADFDCAGPLPSVCYLDVVTPRGVHATYRAVVVQDAQLQLHVTVPLSDFHSLGTYQLRVAVDIPGGRLISQQCAELTY